MEAGHPLGQRPVVTRVANINLRTANVHEWSVDNLTQQAHPALGLKVGNDIGDNLAFAHLDLRRSAVVRLEMRHDTRRFEVFAVHLSWGRTVCTGNDAVVRISRVIEEHGPAGDIRQQHAGWYHYEVRLAEGYVLAVIQ